MIERVPVLTIAGSDSCGGAGIQADLKTMTALYVYGMSAITALTAQNTLGVQGILPVSADFLGQQLDAICTDIPPEAVKIGMIASPEQVDIICAKIQQYHLKKVVVDPVMVATTGAELTERTTVDAMREQLFAQADLLTPNLSETAVLLGKAVQTVEEMQAAAKQLAEQYQTAVLVKGGHLTEDAIDVLYDGSTMQCFSGARIATKNTHGTGCTLSSAIAANWAKGHSLSESRQNYMLQIVSKQGCRLDTETVQSVTTMQNKMMEESNADLSHTNGSSQKAYYHPTDENRCRKGTGRCGMAAGTGCSWNDLYSGEHSPHFPFCGGNRHRTADKN